MKDKSEGTLWRILVALILIAVIISAFRVGQASIRETNLVTPHVVGVYTPLLTSLEGPTNIVVVLDANNKYHVQLSKDISNALQQIEELKGGQQ